MRSVSLLIVIAAGCAHHEPPALVLNDHLQYEGKPGYLRCPAPRIVDTAPCPNAAQPVVAERATGTDFTVGGGNETAARPPDQLRPALPPMSKMQRVDRMRAVLAAIDAHVAGLDDQPSHEQRLVLQ